MAPTAKLAFAATAALIGAIVLFVLGTEPTALPPAARASAAPEPATASGTMEDGPEVVQREAAGPAAGSLPELGLAHPYAYELRCRVIDRDGLPVRGAQIFLSPEACALNTWPEPTGDDGSVLVRWRGRQEAMWMTVGVRRANLDQMLRRIEVHAGAEREIVLLGEQRQAGTFHLSFAQVPNGRSGEVTLKLSARPEPMCVQAGAGGDCRACHEGPQVRGVFDSRLKVRQGLHPEATFADLLLPRGAPVPAASELVETAVAELVGGRSKAITFSFADSLVRPDASADNRGRIVGRVFAADGAPAAGVTIAWGKDVMRRANRTRTGEDGAFACDGVPHGTIELRCGGGDQGLASTTVSVVEGADTRIDVVLDRGAAITGRAVGKDGAPLQDWRVEYVAHDESWTDACTVRADGTFVLPNLPSGGGRLLLWPQQGTQLPVAIERSVLPDVAEVVFDLRQVGEPRGGLRVRPLLPHGVAAVGAEVRVWQQASGRGAVMEQTKDAAFVLQGLAPGFYRVEIGGEAFGWRDLGQHWVDGESVCDLGMADLPRPGRVHIARAGDVAGHVELYARRPDGDVRAEDVGCGGDALLLPAGEWLALWRTGEDEVHGRTFTLHAGAAVDLEVGDDRR